MMKTIGIVAEGPRDFELISAVIDTITDQENNYHLIQPEPNADGKLGNGWKGVWKWCEKNQGRLNTYMHALTPGLDLLIIHMDGDVHRCEKEIHCMCQRMSCTMPENTHPLQCEKIIDERELCPVSLPCEKHRGDCDSGAEFLREFIKCLLMPEDGLAVSCVIPYDATDTWIVAAMDEYDDCENYELFEDPWKNIIAKASNYHGIKIQNRPRKAKKTYEKLIPYVCENWSTVVEKCPQAKRFDEDIKMFLDLSDTER